VAVAVRLLAVLGMQQRLVDDGVGDRRAEVALAVAQGAQRLLQLGRAGVFEQVAMGAAFQGPHDQVGVGVHRQDQHLAGAAACAQLCQGIEAAGRAHGNVQQDDVGCQVAHVLKQQVAVIGFTGNAVARDVGDQCTDPGADQRVVVHQQQSTGHGR